MTLTCVQAAELGGVGDKPYIPPRTEVSRIGYREGYIAALREMERLHKLGFSREKEKHNIMWDHAGNGLKRWVHEAQGEDCYKAPKAWTGSSWWTIRDKVFDRDGRACEQCGSTKHPHIDHIHEVKEGGKPQLWNLRVLCRKCNLARNHLAQPAKNSKHNCTNLHKRANCVLCPLHTQHKCIYTCAVVQRPVCAIGKKLQHQETPL